MGPEVLVLLALLMLPELPPRAVSSAGTCGKGFDELFSLAGLSCGQSDCAFDVLDSTPDVCAMISCIPPLVCHGLGHAAIGRAVRDLAVRDLAIRRAIDSLATDSAVNGVNSRGPVDLSLEIARSIPASLFRDSNLALAAVLALARRLGPATAQVAGDEELDEQVGQGSKVEDIQPDGKSLTRGVDARNDLLLIYNLLGGSELEDSVSYSCWNFVADDACGGGISHLGRNAEDKLLKIVQKCRTIGGGRGS